MELCGAIFYVQGGTQWRSWNIRHDHDTEDFPALKGIRGTANAVLKPGKNEISIRQTEDLNSAKSSGSMVVKDVDYKMMRSEINFITSFTITGKMLLQVDIELESDFECLGLSNGLVLERTDLVQPLGVPRIRNLAFGKLFDFNRSLRAYVPVSIRGANPTFHLKLQYETDQRIPISNARVTIDVTCVLQVMNSNINYLGYGEEENDAENWEII